MRVILAILATFSVTAFALYRPLKLEIDGQRMADWFEMTYAWSGNFVFSDFKEVKVNGHILKPYVLERGHTIFLRADDGTGDYRIKCLKTCTLRRAISCENQAAAIPEGVEVTDAAILKAGEAVLARPLEDQYLVDGQAVTLFICPAN